MKAIIYCRKSTEGTEKQALSLESQLDFCRDIARQEGLEVIQEIEESMSAKSPGRPGFAKLMDIISKGKADTVICWKLNRLARNMVDGGSICFGLTQGMIQKIHTTDGVYNPETNTLLLSVHFGLSTMYSIDLKKDVLRGMTTAVKKGQVVRKAPIGYKYDKNNKSVLPTEKAFVIKKIFEWRAEGASMGDIQKKAESLGLKTSRSNIEFILENHFYYGFMEWQGDYYKGNYTPLISKELYDQANFIKKGSHSKHEGAFFLKGKVKTTDKKPLRASLKKGKYIYYHGHGINLAEDILLKKFEEVLPYMYIPEEDRGNFLLAVQDWEKMHMLDGIQESQALETRKKGLLTRKESLFEMRISGEIEKDVYAQKNKEIHDQILKIDDELKKVIGKDDDLKEKAIALVELWKDFTGAYKRESQTGRSLMASQYTVELLVHTDKELKIELFEPFQSLVSRNIQYGGASWTTVELFNLVRIIREIPLSQFQKWKKTTAISPSDISTFDGHTSRPGHRRLS